MSILDLDLTYFTKSHLAKEARNHLAMVDDPTRTSDVLFNKNGLAKIKEASKDRCFYLMVDVIHLKSKHRQFNSMEVLDKNIYTL